jgi:NADPH oxidase 2
MIFSCPIAISRTAALILHFNVALILIPVSRDFLSILRRTPLNNFIPFDRSVSFHIATAWSMVFWTVVHILAHMVNFVRLAQLGSRTNTAGEIFLTFLSINFSTGPGVTGWLMTIFLAIMVFFASEKQRRINFERFWYSHHLFIVLFICWQLHGMFCMIKPDRPPYCSSNSVGILWVSCCMFCTHTIF